MNTVAAANCQSHSPHTLVPRAAEFAEAWLDEITNLYLLSFLLTADKVLAEQCFSDAMTDYIGGSRGLTDWSNGPGKAAVIRRAYQVIRPMPKRVHSWSFVPGARPLLSAANQPFSAITLLGAFERFVFVLSTLEGYADEVCAALLECELADIAESRDLANKLVAALELDEELPRDSAVLPVTTTLISQHCALC